MTRTQFVAAIAANLGRDRTDVDRVLGATIDVIAATLRSGDYVKINDFGVFEARERKARVGRDPRNGQPVSIAAATRIRFRAGKGLMTSVNAP